MAPTALTPAATTALATTAAEVAQAAAKDRVYFSVKPTVLIGSHPKVGKTTDSVFTLPNAMFLYSDGGLKSAVSTVGWAPLDSDNKSPTLTAAIQAITERIKLGRGGAGLVFKNAAGQAMSGVVVDDFTLKARAELAYLQANPPKTSDGKSNTFAVWTTLGQRVVTLFKLVAEMGMPIYFSAHLREPGVDDKTKERIPGGPDVVTAALSAMFPGLVDLIAYVVDDPTRTRWPHGLSANTRGGNWLAGDRHNIVSTGLPGQAMTTPINTAEVLRAAGYILPRPLHMDEWIEPVIQNYGLPALMAFTPQQVVAQEIYNQARKNIAGVEPWQIAWCLRDLTDRHEILTRSSRFNPLAAWGITV